ncbi:hypothetical protein P256_00368 [Acinetobacter nectaris CIP 110549]|uniref:Heat shock protein 15 n=1 Tax=Acinetobacter nectaris CIP 110549 TaxID=1392540 RepID=V2TYX3_9GAMM|nr:S4 domain-containing protein [Acinetobacter nectaris]ESK40940.1 hypothetical protein P256_00368 [Acinetobacter nectaris CIP 110549]MCF8999136.1 RNA-binding protein [Acinetobacter nectaris]MCF9026586.1 RNA-binding protein [Acinetobacter nectaris]
MKQSVSPKELEHMRIDKWLWAARFFKTRSIAKAAIEGGKVHHASERVKVSKEIRVGMELTIQQGKDKKTVTIKSLSNTRGPAPIAQQLYEETPLSISRRELISAQRKLDNLAKPENRPNKRDRRKINQFKEDNSQSYDEQWSYHHETY